MRTFRARFESTCSGCVDEIKPGQIAVQYSRIEIYHEDCAPQGNHQETKKSSVEFDRAKREAIQKYKERNGYL